MTRANGLKRLVKTQSQYFTRVAKSCFQFLFSTTHYILQISSQCKFTFIIRLRQNLNKWIKLENKGSWVGKMTRARSSVTKGLYYQVFASKRGSFGWMVRFINWERDDHEMRNILRYSFEFRVFESLKLWNGARAWFKTSPQRAPSNNGKLRQCAFRPLFPCI